MYWGNAIVLVCMYVRAWCVTNPYLHYYQMFIVVDKTMSFFIFMVLSPTGSSGYCFSLVPRPSPAPVFDHLQYAKTEGEGLVNLTMWSAAQTSHVVTLICIAMLGRRPILRSELATKTRKVLTENTIKRTKHIWVRRNGSERLPNDVCEISAVTKFS